MKQYAATNIKNIVIAGHSNGGKTSIAEALLFSSGATDRLGTIAAGNTVCDYDPEEIKRLASVATTVVPFEWKGNKINLLDTPGLFDFAQGVSEGIRAAETALIVVSAKSGVSVGAEKAFEAAGERGMARAFFINKLDSNHANFETTYAGLKKKFGVAVCPIVIPYVVDHCVQCYVNMINNKAFAYKDGKAVEVAIPEMPNLPVWKTEVYEAIAETDEALMEKYFEGEPFTAEEIATGLKKGIVDGSVFPVFCGATQVLHGVDILLDAITDIFPTAAEKGAEFADKEDERVELKVDINGKTAAVVFKTVADPFVGKMSFFKVVSGKMASDMQLLNMRTGELERIGKLITVKGKKQEEAEYIGAGDIGAATKLPRAITGDTLCDSSLEVKLAGVKSPNPSLSMAILPTKKGDEEKIAQGLHRLKEEDPTVAYYNNVETHQMIVIGLGEQHLDIVASRLKSKFGVDVKLEKPKVAYRETIKKKVSVQGRHKKQSGGHGQFGDVWIEFEPCACDGLEFAERVVGGSVPKNFFPAVEKGLRDSIAKGVLAGYPMVGIKATLYDGSYHPVDSSEMSFKMAASIAYKNGVPLANPVLLEPYGTLQVTVPEDNMGDVIGELNKRRGSVLGMNPGKSGYQVIDAEAPMAEMFDFTTFLRQVAQGRGSFTFEFARYEEAPPVVAQKVIEKAKKEAAAE